MSQTYKLDLAREAYRAGVEVTVALPGLFPVRSVIVSEPYQIGGLWCVRVRGIRFHVALNKLTFKRGPKWSGGGQSGTQKAS